jgi:uncharacterized protein (DUF1919 family)
MGDHLQRLRTDYEETCRLQERGIAWRCQQLLRRLGIASGFPAYVRRIGLENRDFTIVSDNCWGGYVYRHFGLPYRSPFVGLFLFPSCYLELLEDFERSMAAEPEFIEASASKHQEQLAATGSSGSYPIGRLRGSVEIHFLHFASATDAKAAWLRRRRHINPDNMLFKMSDRLGPTPEQVRAFDALPFRHKVFLAADDHPVSCARSSRELDLKGLLNAMKGQPRPPR